MDKLKKIAVLLSSFNGESYIKPQIDSILNQVGVDLLLLIRDDGSTDSTRSILTEYAEKNMSLKVIEGENVGSTKSFMKLIEYANEHFSDYDYFSFADQDDLWLKNKLQKAIKKLEYLESNKPNMYCSNLKVVDYNLNFINFMRTAPIYTQNKAKSLVESFATGCTVVFNKATLKLVADYAPRNIILHDLWIFHTCMFLGNIVYDPNAYILYRQHQSNQIGAKSTIKARLRSKIKSLKSLSKQHFREEEAKTLLNTYKGLLLPKDISLLNILVNYRKVPIIKIKWLLGISEPFKQIRMTKIKDNWILKIRILIGHV